MELINQILPQIEGLRVQCIFIEFGVKREEGVGVEIQVLSSLLGELGPLYMPVCSYAVDIMP